MLCAGVLLAFQETAPAAAAPQARGWEDFPVFVWRERYAGKPLPEELVEPFGGVILMREEDSSWARERGLSYLVWNVAGRDALHLDADEAWNARVEKWIETHDEKLLVREPCLNDPKTMEQLCATLDATIAKHGEHPGLGFVLGDEVGLTPNGDPFDLCRCGACEAKWRQYARVHGLPERAPLTDEVRLALADGDHALLGAWLARRRFDREQLAGLFSTLVERIRSRTPFEALHLGQFPAGLLGLRGATAFGGIDLAAGFEWLRFLEVYPVNDARELQLGLPELQFRGMGSELQGSLATLFVADESPDSAAWRVWEHWLRGGNGVVLWSDAALSERPHHRERIAGAVRTIRSLGKLFPELLPPSNVSVGLVQDADSVALAWLRDALLDGPTWPRRRAGFQDRNGSRETSVRGWIAHLEDLGLLPASVPLERLAQHRWDFDVLVLPEVCVLDPEDFEQLAWHVEERGNLVVEGTFGWVDRAGRPLENDRLARLCALAPESVVRVRAHEYRLPERDLAALLEGRPTFRGEAATVPWLSAHRATKRRLCFDPEATSLLVLLPRLDRPEHRGRFAAGLELDGLGPPSGCAWERLHPPAGERLAPGDAAVFEVRLLPAKER